MYDPEVYADEHEARFYGDAPFADPGNKNSSLRAGKRKHKCPTCKQPNRLSDEDVRRGYQCDPCADRAERGGDY